MIALLAAATTASGAGIPKIKTTPRELRATSPARLGSRMFGAASPAFAFAKVGEQKEQYSSFEVQLATAPAPSGYAGLCILKRGSMLFRTDRSTDVGNDRRVSGASSASVYDAFILSADGSPMLVASNAGRCTTPPPGDDAAWWTSIHDLFYKPLRTDDPGPAVVARFGLATVLAAQGAGDAVPVRTLQCDLGEEKRVSCRDARDFLRTVAITDIDYLSVYKCRREKTWCVSGRFYQPDHRSVDDFEIATAETTIARNSAATPMLRSIELLAGGRRIID